MQKQVRRSANECKSKCEGVQVKANASAMVLTKEDGRIERNRLRGRGYKLLGRTFRRRATTATC